MPDPGQAQPTAQPQQPQTPPAVSDKTIDAFMAVDDNKKRDALSKMSEPTKQALLQGIKTRKAPQPGLTPTEKAHPFGSGVATGGMFDAEKIGQQKTTLGSMKEVGKEMGSGALDFAKSVAKDPLNVGNPIDQMVKIEKDAYRDVHDGLKSGNHDQTMHGLGLAVGHLAMLLGGAKSSEDVAKVGGGGGGGGFSGGARDAVFAAKDLTAKRAIVSAASHATLDALKDDHSQALDTAVKAERQRIGGAVQALNTKDIAADPKGYVPQKLALATLDQAVSDKKAQVLLDKRMLPKVAQVRGLLEGHAQNLTFNDLKQVRSVVGDSLSKATGVEKAVLGDYYSSLSKNLKGRAAHLGGLPEWEDYNSSAEKLADHEGGLIPELKDSKTGLEYAKKIVSEQNQGRLNNLAKDLHMPYDFFQKAAKEHKAIINFAKMSEGDSLVAKTANRLIALKQHPIAASLGGALGVTAGRALGTAVGSPMAGSFIGLTLGAAAAHELMSKYDAAKAIREIGGPSGVMGTRPSAPQNQSSKQAPGGPTGGGSPSALPPQGGGPPPAQPPGITPGSSSPSVGRVNPSTVSSSLLKLLKLGWVQEAEGDVEKAGKDVESLKQRVEDAKKGMTPRLGQGSNAFDKPDTRVQASEAKAEPKVTKASPETKSITTAKVNKPYYEMNVDELKKELDRETQSEKQDAIDVFGKEKAAKYEKLVRASESSNHVTADAASKLRQEMEDGLTPEQQDRLFGKSNNFTNLSAEDIKHFHEKVSSIQGENEAELGRSMKQAMTDIGQADLKKPELMDPRQQRAYAMLRAGSEIAQSKGWDLNEVYKEAFKASAKQFRDPEDAAFMLRRFAPEERGRMESTRSGMTKDTPEARKAKAAERIAARRAEASRTNIKTSLEDQARQVAGKMDFQGKSNIELEEGLQTLFGENGKRFLKQFQSLARQQKWSEEVYRGYLEDTIDRRAKELAQRPNIPGLGTEPVQEEPVKSEPKVESKPRDRVTNYEGGKIIHPTVQGHDFVVRKGSKLIGYAPTLEEAQKMMDDYRSGGRGAASDRLKEYGIE